MIRDCIKLLPVVLVTFVLVDAVWLGLVAPKFYRSQIGFLLADKPNWYAAVAFYIIFIIGLTVFVVQPAITKESLLEAALMGALFGFVCYATYDLTNLATVKGWPILVTVVDLAWGATLCGATAFVSTWFAKKWIF